MYAASGGAMNDALAVFHASPVGVTSKCPTGDAWKTASASFIAPPEAAYILVYHQLNSVGTLVIDNIVLKDMTLENVFDRGFVSLAFDDGHRSQYENARSILNTAGIKATFYAVSHNSGFGVANPSFETPAVGDAGKPLGWSHAAGTNSTYTYPVTGRSGHAAQITSTGAETESGWRSAPVTVLADQSHQFTHYYKSTGTSTLYIEVNNTDGTIGYIQPAGDVVGVVVPFVTLPPASEWTEYKSSELLWIPPTAKSVSVRFNLPLTGTLAIDDVNFGAYRNFMTPSNLRDLENDQHEIGGHSETHADLTGIPFAEAQNEVQGSRAELLLGGLTPVLTFAYPLGNNNEAIQTEVAGAGYTSARGTVPGMNGKGQNKFELKSHMVLASTPLSQLEQWINDAVAERSWLILTFHQILPEGAQGSGMYTTTPSRLSSMVQYLASNNVLVRTVSDGVAHMNGTGSPSGMTATTTTATTTPTTTATTTVATTPTPAPTPSPAPSPSPSPSTGGGVLGTSGFIYWGCTIPTAMNYNRLANTNDNSCVFGEVLGATTTAISNGTEAATNATSTIVVPPQGIVMGSTARGIENRSMEMMGGTTSPASEIKPKPLKPKKITPRFKKYLRQGSRGAEVMELQKHLFGMGQFTGPITGYFGNLTFTAVQKLQQTYNIDQVGHVGPKTRALLNKMDQEGPESWVVISTGSELSIQRI